ncbi:MAG TPA: hypothetical protein VHD37_02675, partial [Candidatus Paceibacterota bacterium]|nr:hypothetical protein [Candidatus Paceibacterota bacterium]
MKSRPSLATRFLFRTAFLVSFLLISGGALHAMVLDEQRNASGIIDVSYGNLAHTGGLLYAPQGASDNHPSRPNYFASFSLPASTQYLRLWPVDGSGNAVSCSTAFNSSVKPYNGVTNVSATDYLIGSGSVSTATDTSCILSFSSPPPSGYALTALLISANFS